MPVVFNKHLLDVHQMGFASGELIAHVNYMLNRGPPDLRSRPTACCGSGPPDGGPPDAVRRLLQRQRLVAEHPLAMTLRAVADIKRMLRDQILAFGDDLVGITASA